MKAGSHKSIVFTPPPVMRDREEIRKADRPESEVNALVCFADLLRDSATIHALAKELLTDSHSMHGSLQAIRSLSVHLQKTSEKLITHLEVA